MGWTQTQKLRLTNQSIPTSHLLIVKVQLPIKISIPVAATLQAHS